MQFEWIQIPYALLTLFIVVNFGFILTAFIAKIGARVGRRHGIPIWQNYADLIKNSTEADFMADVIEASQTTPKETLIANVWCSPGCKGGLFIVGIRGEAEGERLSG